MYIHKDRHGRQLRFVNAKAFKVWKREQDAKYVPAYVPNDVTSTLGVGLTYDRRKASGSCKRFAVN